uniref:Uncharacterized protein n=1 Tax=Anguilla anguilla TaxID=7936 RepID=A0A0E9PVX0_ANGAN
MHHCSISFSPLNSMKLTSGNKL